MRARRAEGHRPRALPALVAWLAILGALAPGICCAAPAAQEKELPVAVVETARRLAIHAEGDGLVQEVGIELTLFPLESWPVDVLGRRPEGQTGDDALVEIRVKWTDYAGVMPMSWGRSFRRAVPFGADGEASRDEPLVRTFSLHLDPPEDRALARRLEAWARLHPVDVVGPEVRSGGVSLEFPTATAETFRRVPEASLEDLLAADDPPDPADVFLAAVTRATRERAVVLRQLVEALPRLSEERREPVFGALQYLTEETHGRSVARWEEWLTLHGDEPAPEAHLQ
jgi:hypothetical protein